MSICDSFSLHLLAFWLPTIPAVHKREVCRVFSAAYLDTFVLDRKKQRCSPACPSYALSRVHCFHSGRCSLAWLGFLWYFCQEGRDVITHIATCLGVLQWWVAAFKKGRCLKTNDGHHLGVKCCYQTHSKSFGKLLLQKVWSKTRSNLANRFRLPLSCEKWNSWLFVPSRIFYFSVLKKRQLNLETIEQLFSTLVSRTFKFKMLLICFSNWSVIKNANCVREFNKPKGKQSIWLHAEMVFMMS